MDISSTPPLSLDVDSADTFADAMFQLLVGSFILPADLLRVIDGVRPEVRRRIERRLGHLILTHPVNLHANCPRCRQRGETPSR
jgi:hypothetical protein